MCLFTLLVIPFPFHFLDLFQVDQGIFFLLRSQTSKKVSDNRLVSSRGRRCQAGQVLEDQLFAIPGETQEAIAGNMYVQCGQIFGQRQMPKFTF